MVDLLDVDMTKPENAANEPDGELSLDMKVARGGTYALWSLCKSKRNRLLIKKAGGFPLLARLIKSKNISLLIPVIGTLQECAAEKSYCMAIQAEGMVEDFVSNLLNDNMELRKHCASAIFNCAQVPHMSQICNASPKRPYKEKFIMSLRGIFFGGTPVGNLYCVCAFRRKKRELL